MVSFPDKMQSDCQGVSTTGQSVFRACVSEESGRFEMRGGDGGITMGMSFMSQNLLWL